jgi:hypothetical protein
MPHAIIWVALLVARPARAVDPFEIQVYDGSADPPGVPGLELHLNTVPIGRKFAEPPELPADGQSHFTLEPSLGILPWWEVGAYLQTALRGDGAFTYAGTKLRSKFVTPPGYDPHWRFGVNLEVSVLPEAYDRDRWGTEVRPIIAWENELWHFALNPILDTSLAGPGSRDGPSFEPAVMATIKIDQKVDVGIEYYANIGPVVRPAAWSEQEHYVFEAFDLLSVERFELNAGIGEGFGAGSNSLVLKVIVGYAWEKDGRRSDLRGRL